LALWLSPPGHTWGKIAPGSAAVLGNAVERDIRIVEGWRNSANLASTKCRVRTTAGIRLKGRGKLHRGYKLRAPGREGISAST
jgi:hypothetical protein